MSLLGPGILLLFAGIFDVGMYCRALITVDNAARAAVLHTSVVSESAADSQLACAVVLAQMRSMPDAANLSTCNTAPVVVSASSATDAEGFEYSQVSVTYRTPQMFTLPFLPGQLTLARTAEMRVRP